MKSPKASLTISALLTSTLLLAQTAPTSQPDQQETLVLSPFEVSASTEHGYLATSGTSATKVATPIRDLPQGFSVLTADFLRDLDMRNIKDAVDYATGISRSNTNRTNADDNFIIRGTLPGQLLTDGLIDHSGTADEPAWIDRIEIIRGPAAVLYGSGSFGGRVNRLSKRPLFTPAYELSASYGSHNYKYGTADLTGPIIDQKLAYRVIATQLDRDDFVQYSGNKRTFVSPSLLWKPAAGTSIFTSIRYLEQERKDYTQGDLRLGSTIASIHRLNPKVNLVEDFYLRTNEKFNFSAIVDHRVTDWLNVRQSLSMEDRYEKVDFGLTGVNRPAGAPTRIPRAFQIRQITDESYQLLTDIVATYDFLGGKHSTLLSVDYKKQKRDYIQLNYRGDTIDFINPVPEFGIYQVWSAANFTGVAADRTTGDTTPDLGGTIQHQAKFFGDRVQLTAGFRHDKFYSRVFNNVSGLVTDAGEGSHVSPRYGATFRVFQPLSIFLLRAESFEPLGGGNPDGERFTPATAKNDEVGVKLNLFDDRFVATASVYRLVTQGTLQPDRTRPNFAIQTGGRETNGFEADFVYAPDAQWQILGGYSYSVTLDGGIRVAQLPRHTFYMFAKYGFERAGLKGLSIGGGLNGQFDRKDDPAGTRYLPDYVKADAFISYRFNKHWSVSVNAKNVFDKYYYLFSGGETYTPGDPRMISTTATYRF